MHTTNNIGFILSGLAAGIITGLLGAGGGMVLVPLLTLLTPLKEQEIFPCSIAIILPVCVVSLMFTTFPSGIPWRAAFPYLTGSTFGGIIAGLWGKKIPVKWLHRILGILILWGGIRYLC